MWALNEKFISRVSSFEDILVVWPNKGYFCNFKLKLSLMVKYLPLKEGLNYRILLDVISLLTINEIEKIS